MGAVRAGAGKLGTVGLSNAQIVDGSLRFVASKSQYLEKTFSSAGNRRTWTWSGWVKRAGSSASNKHNMFGTWNPSEGAYTTGFMLGFDDSTDDVLRVEDDFNNSDIAAITTAVFRDFSAGWYHIVLSMDTTQSTVGAGLKFYVNGVHRPEMSGTSWTQNHQTNINNGSYPHYLGIDVKTLTRFFDGEMSQVYFIDGQALTPSYFGYTDPLTNTWRPKKAKITLGSVWSNYFTGIGIIDAGSVTNVFDGNTATEFEFNSTGGNGVFRPPNPISYSTSVEVYSARTTTMNVSLNGGSNVAYGNGWTTIASGSGTLTYLTFSNGNAGNQKLGAIRVDGNILTNTSDAIDAGTNGFYLPLDGNTPIGQDKSGRGNNWTPVNFGCSNTIEKATGALPILNTDGGGKVARVGVRTDSNASSLVLALPLVGIKSDFSNAINSGTSNKAIIANGSAASSNTTSNFYGGSFNFGTATASAVYPNATSSDFAFGTGDFTVEFWFYSTATSRKYLGDFRSNGAGGASAATGPFIIWADNGSDSTGTRIRYGNNAGTPDFDLLGGRGLPPINTWHHLAIVRSSNTVSGYLNGVLTNSTTDSTNYSTNTSFAFGNNSNNTSNFSGYLQDLRIYKGLAKYTQNFIPASTDPDILPDTPSGVSYSSNVALVPSTDGAVAFDGVDDYLTVPYSTDFNFDGDFTLECFVYFSSLPSAVTYGMKLISVGDGNTSGWYFGADTNNKIYIGPYGWASGDVVGATSVVAGSWYHVACVRSSGTITIYVNGIADGSAAKSGTTGNSGNTALHIGTYSGAAGNSQHTLIGFLSNLQIVKGTALYTSNFTPPTGPISSVANTKLLCCKSNSSATAFDVSPGTITSVNAIASNFNPFTVNINAVRGQESGYCTLNPLHQNASNITLSEGNLRAKLTGGSNWWTVGSTIAVNSGKYYFEVDVLGGQYHMVGITSVRSTLASGDSVGSVNGGVGYFSDNGNKYVNGSNSSYGSTYTTGDTIGCAFNIDDLSVTFYKNGISQGAISNSIISGNEYTPVASLNDQGTGDGEERYNFGQKPFKFPPPAGFQPLALANTPRPTIVRPDQYVGIVTYLGTSSARSITVGFKPDLVWCKDRTGAGNHNLHDSVRGSTKILFSNLTNAELTDANSIISFDPYGFSFGNNPSNNSDGNISGRNTVAWCWKAGGNSNTYNINDVGYATTTAAGLTAGDSNLLTGASINTKSGFSILKANAPSSNINFSLPHGLGTIPKFIIYKHTGVSSNWQVNHASGGNNGTDNYNLNGTGGPANASLWDAGAHTTSVINFPNDIISSLGGTVIVYAWAEIPGFSKFGSYTGNGSADGPVVVTEFRPRWILIKKSSGTENWRLHDTVRSPYNVMQSLLFPNLANAETTNAEYNLDALSNGFKIRTNVAGSMNDNGATYIYCAFAETPSFNLYGGQANAR